jgi:hypothetical protein
LHLRGCLADVFGARTGAQQRELRLRLCAFGLGAPKRRSARAVSAVSRRAMTSPAVTRAPSVTFISSNRPPTSEAARTSVAST